MFKKVGLVLGIVLFVSLRNIHAEVEQNNQKRSFTFSSGYVEKATNSNEGLSAFPLSMIQLYSKGFDAVTGTPQTPSARVLVAALELPFSYWFAHSLFIPFHEFGHGRVSLSQGIDTTYGTTAFGNTVSGISNYWGLSFYRLFTPPFGFPGAGGAYSTRVALFTNSLTTNLNQYYGNGGLSILSGAGGLNNQMVLAKKVADLVYRDNGHITYFQHYIGNKITGFVYSQLDGASSSYEEDKFSTNSDIKAILRGYQLNNYNISRSSIETQSLVSLLSGTTVSFLIGYANYFSKGDPTVRPLEVADIRIPDINSYINAKGLSYEFVTGYRLSSNLFFDLAYERITVGDLEQQLIPRAHYQLASLFPSLNDFWISSDLVIGGGVGGSVELKWAPYNLQGANFLKTLSYFLKCTNYNGYTLYGERNIPFARNQDTSNELLMGFNYRY